MNGAAEATKAIFARVLSNINSFTAFWKPLRRGENLPSEINLAKFLMTSVSGLKHSPALTVCFCSVHLVNDVRLLS